MDTQDTITKTASFIRNSATLKIMIIGALILILLIPTSMISSLLYERQERRDSVIDEINHKWGSSQVITGPFFSVPYKTFFNDRDNKLITKINFLHIMPEKLNISGIVNPHIRYRSSYEAVLYNTQISLEGSFKFPEVEQLNIGNENILWDKAHLSLGVTDMRGIQDNIIFSYNETEYNASPGLKTADIAPAGVSSLIALKPNEAPAIFSLKLNLNGSEQLRFIPIGGETSLKLSSTWPSPSFNGAFLPASRNVSEKGFEATWKVLQLNRNYPQYWVEDQYKILDSSFGLDLLIATDIYQKSERISKYAIMFIVFTFAAFFFSEIISKNRIHPIQYLLVGLAICLFYILLLSISEQFSFNIAYLISAVAVTLLISGYSRCIIRNKYFTLTIFSILVSLYSYLYIVIQQEDFSLIMGSVGLFVVLSVVMYITRNINWYALESDTVEKI